MASKYDHFKLVTDFELRGDQARAIDELVEGLNRGDKAQVLLGVTGSGKTFTMAQCIARVNRPTLVMAHNKTLAAQLYQEFRRFFPENAVEYFVSYYDYYQPEAYVPTTDSYIEKEATINDEIDRMRLSATRSLFERRDVIIVASVSCIYGLGSPEAYYGMMLPLERGQRIDRDQILRKLVEIQYERNDHDFDRGAFRVRGDIVEVYPSYEDTALRIELFGDEVDELTHVRSADRQDDPQARQGRGLPEDALRHAARPDQAGGRDASRRSWTWYRAQLETEGKVLEAQRLHQRTMFDLEMIKEIGYCHGIENYARHLTGRRAGRAAADAARLPAGRRADHRRREPPDRAAGPRHVSRRPLAQGGAGRLRLPAAVGARQPAAELRGVGEARSASCCSSRRRPGPYELQQSGGAVVEQIIRPTGLVDPVDRRPAGRAARSTTCCARSATRAARSERVLVTTLTKRMAEDLTQVLPGARRQGALPALGHRYARADRDPARPAARASSTCWSGINLLREGLDLPEVSLVAILDADKEGFLRSGGSLIQTVGPRRAQRQRPGDHVRRHDDRLDAAAPSARPTAAARSRRRTTREHGITPASIVKSIDEVHDAASTSATT